MFVETINKFITSPTRRVTMINDCPFSLDDAKVVSKKRPGTLILRNTNVIYFTESMPSSMTNDLRSKDSNVEYYKVINNRKYGVGYIFPMNMVSKIKQYDPECEIIDLKKNASIRDIDIEFKGINKTELQESVSEFYINLDANSASLPISTLKAKFFILSKIVTYRTGAFNIVVNNKNSMRQWKSLILNHTNINANEILEVNTLSDLVLADNNVQNFKCIIMIGQVVSNLLDNEDSNPFVTQLLNKFNASTFFYDDAIFQLHSVFTIMAFTDISQSICFVMKKTDNDINNNILQNYVLPTKMASEDEDDTDEDDLVDDDSDQLASDSTNLLYDEPTVKTVGKSGIGTVDFVYALTNSFPDKDAKLLISKPKGLLMAEYCRYMKSKSFVKIIMTACGFIDEIYKNSNYKKKVVITVGTLDLLDSTVNFLRKKYTNLNIGEYSTNIKSPDKRLAQITENDIIVSTEKLFAKCSNTDVEMIINCVPLYYNEVFCDLFSQLKKYERYHLAKFVQIVDLGFPSYIAMTRENVSMLNYEIKNFKSISAVSLTNTSNDLFDFINEK